MAAGRINAFLRGFGGLFSWVDVLNRRLLPVSSAEFSSELVLPTPESLRLAEEANPGSADRLLTLAEQEQMARAKYEFLGLMAGFATALALIALSAITVSLGYAWLCVGIIGGGAAAMAYAHIYSSRARERQQRE